MCVRGRASLVIKSGMWVWAHYGTALRSIYTMYEITFSGSWPIYARPVYEKMGHGFVVFFVLYVTVIVFAITRVISAIFLRDTLEAASNDAEMQVHEKLKKKSAYVMKLKALFQALDSTGNGIITQDVLNQLLEDPKVIAHFQILELDVHEGAALFHVLDDGDGEITCEEFIDGILRCHGPARAIDQLAMHAEMRQLSDTLANLKQSLQQANIISPRQKMRSTFRMRANAKTFRHLNAFRMPLMPQELVQPKRSESSREAITNWQLGNGVKSPESIM
ncbi:TPC1B [Symbiodinium natans]|uniref:TPC1B protein n=1 Tax=Symbiodinium natans TaxID=878477 RepID=A0A812M540_9DINO|nr:TPC1B [Symbiodinium natans]